jgi:exosortase K
LFAVIGCAFALKLHYSTASVNDLRWILAPTTFLVELISGRTFAFESYAGYMSSDHTFLIAASCAGVNFFITAFLLLTLKRLWTNRSGSWTFIPVAGFVAFIATLFANTIRISIALQLQRNPLNLEWLSPDQFHRLEGICGSERLIYGARSRRLMPESVETVARVPWSVSVLGLLFPLLVYYITTLGFPLINGAFRLENFWEHALFVLLAPLFFYLPFAAVRVAFQIRRQR